MSLKVRNLLKYIMVLFVSSMLRVGYILESHVIGPLSTAGRWTRWTDNEFASFDPPHTPTVYDTVIAWYAQQLMPAKEITTVCSLTV